jgi:glutamyl-tRNA reductase
MRYKKEETYESWCNQVCAYEKSQAIKEIAQGKSVDDVLEKMSRRIIKKLMHPIFLEIRGEPPSMSEVEADKKSYEDKYLKHTSPRADQIED